MKTRVPYQQAIPQRFSFNVMLTMHDKDMKME